MMITCQHALIDDTSASDKYSVTLHHACLRSNLNDVTRYQGACWYSLHSYNMTRIFLE